MREKGQAAVGAFVLGGVILAVGAVLLFGRLHFGTVTTRAVIVFQDSISGLAVGAPVTFRGVRVGSVLSIRVEFEPSTHVAYIPVIIRLYRSNVRVSGKNYDDPLLGKLIADGLRAELNTVSFVTGQSEIDLDLDPSSPAVLHPALTDLMEIPTKVSDIERVKQQLTQLPLRDLADNAIATLRSVHRLTDTLGDDLPALVNSVKSTSDRAGNTVEAASHAIADLQARLDTTLATINRLANSGDRQINLRGADLHLLLVQSAQTVAKARDMVNSLQTLTSGRAGPRIDIEATLRDLAAAAASLRGFAGDVEHNPQLLLTGRRN